MSFGAADLTHYFRTQPAAKKHQLLYTFALKADEYTTLMQASQLRVTAGQLKIVLPLSRLADIRKVLDDCEADLLTTWGMSREVQAQLASFPRPQKELNSYFTGSDYPSSALDSGNIGVVEARLTVGADGTPRDCKVINSSGHKDLDTITCRIAVDRVRFDPARTINGQAIESPYFLYLNWMIAE
jgi:TonB family protein